MKDYYSEVDNKSSDEIIIKGKDGASYLPKDTDNSPRLPAQSTAQIVQSILSQPAPVPQRQPAAVGRDRAGGVVEKSTPIVRATASAIRSSKYLALTAGAGLVVYIAVPTLPVEAVAFGTLIAMAGVMLLFDKLEYRHSQAGVERLRTRADHKLETLHEINRHDETMAAIQGDIAIKLKVLDLAAGARKIVDKGGER